MIQGSYSNRIILICLLVLILAFISYYYAHEVNQNLEYPSYNAILNNYPVGEVVSIQGSVVNVDSEGYLITENYHNQRVEMHVSGQLPGELGDHVSLLGVLKPSYEVGEVKKIHVMSYWKTDISLRGSLAAIIFLSILFFYYWKFDFKRFIFQRRD
ncbi:MAG: hypothetical protein ACC614_09380 [Methanobacterium formicicum]|jgi:uncharacterized membrane protein|uniref:hypothetical protein n=1 Tax=Methanobacterium formicicum TaxID=2162 RepID=UPI003530E918